MRERFLGMTGGRFLMAALAVLLVSSGAWGQKKQKPKKHDQSDQPLPMLPVPASDQIDRDIGMMLGAFQVGDVEAMHKYYSDDATFIRGTYDPPIVGWKNYAALYQQERAAFPAMELVRRNTYIFTHGDAAWASYQWEFNSLYDGKPYYARGQTTLVFTKVGENWIILHNHTSEICPAVQTQQPIQLPAQNPPASPPPHP